MLAFGGNRNRLPISRALGKFWRQGLRATGLFSAVDVSVDQGLQFCTLDADIAADNAVAKIISVDAIPAEVRARAVAKGTKNPPIIFSESPSGDFRPDCRVF
jgi:hypothetical protein